MGKNIVYAPIIPTAEPFLFMGDDIGILLVHGFTGTPKEMRTMGEYLANQGHTILGIRLPGHATQPADMLRTRWADWLHAVEDGYHLLHSAGRKVFIMGLSMGGILTLTAASRLEVTGAVAMSTPYRLPDDPRLPYIKYLAPFVPTVSKGPSDWHDPAMAQEHVDYPAYPTHAIIELRGLLEEMRQSLPKITGPVLLMHSRTDGGVLPENMPRIYDQLGSQDKTMVWLEQSGHVITRDQERQRVFEAAEEFVRRVG
jgi:carboxylesterase